MVLHVVIAIAAGYAVGSEFRRRSMRSWLACAGGNPIVALAGKLAPEDWVQKCFQLRSAQETLGVVKAQTIPAAPSA